MVPFWTNPDKKIIAILCSKVYSKPVQLLLKFVKEVDHQKSHFSDEFAGEWEVKMTSPL
jgi:hypothetical protein